MKGPANSFSRSLNLPNVPTLRGCSEHSGSGPWVKTKSTPRAADDVGVGGLRSEGAVK